MRPNVKVTKPRGAQGSDTENSVDIEIEGDGDSAQGIHIVVKNVYADHDQVVVGLHLTLRGGCDAKGTAPQVLLLGPLDVEDTRG